MNLFPLHFRFIEFCNNGIVTVKKIKVIDILRPNRYELRVSISDFSVSFFIDWYNTDGVSVDAFII